ncbi:MAG TPA: hypothetical protein VIF09_12870 [Polyangiaceae bacterium]
MIGRSRIALGLVLVAAVAGACAHDLPPAPRTAPAPKESSCHHASPRCAGPPPTYTADVRPILERRCFKCHAADGVAADEHDFSRVETLRAQRSAVASEIGACAMPPSSEPPVPDAEAELLLRWVACGGVGADGK